MGVGRAGAVPRHDAHRVDPGTYDEDLLEDDALVAPHRLGNRSNAHLLVAIDLADDVAVAPDGQLDVVVSDHIAAVAPEVQRPVRQRHREKEQCGIGRGTGEVSHGGHEGQARGIDHQTHLAVHGARANGHHVGDVGHRPPRGHLGTWCARPPQKHDKEHRDETLPR